jgi:hypothetical protein
MTVADSHAASSDDAVTTAQSLARHDSEDRPAQTRAEAYDWLAAKFTDLGWGPQEMRAAELVFAEGTPVADAMRAMEAGDTAAGDR